MPPVNVVGAGNQPNRRARLVRRPEEHLLAVAASQDEVAALDERVRKWRAVVKELERLDKARHVQHEVVRHASEDPAAGRRRGGCSEKRRPAASRIRRRSCPGIMATWNSCGLCGAQRDLARPVDAAQAQRGGSVIAERISVVLFHAADADHRHVNRELAVAIEASRVAGRG